ncbi:MAG: hypothetical protein P4L65_09415 [Legionella sp.]|nr:hypothetical protein [Legionella sp.]
MLSNFFQKIMDYTLSYPFYFIEKIIFSGFRLIYGSYLLFNAVFISPTTAAPKIVLGMAYELGSMLLNAINVALAIISLFTKTFGIFNSNNYIDSKIEDETHAAITKLAC